MVGNSVHGGSQMGRLIHLGAERGPPPEDRGAERPLRRSMNDQSPNGQFHASSFLQGHNAQYVEQLYARYASDPGSVDPSWAL